ncbi:hypothetical protein E2C01_084611 [Portunus trituberculatus]|uniref:Uncharacterized protein n=1 Tax=Portunus trituberculatus TaxID=210409 RepID=A0A5B7J876_PORTR|nr:hypothetical protein [Portunus trituberculatus]
MRQANQPTSGAVAHALPLLKLAGGYTPARRIVMMAVNKYTFSQTLSRAFKLSNTLCPKTMFSCSLPSTFTWHRCTECSNTFVADAISKSAREQTRHLFDTTVEEGNSSAHGYQIAPQHQPTIFDLAFLHRLCLDTCVVPRYFTQMSNPARTAIPFATLRPAMPCYHISASFSS